MIDGNLTDSAQRAFGRPGISPKWTSSSKEGVGTAYSTSSRVWFTLSHGILNEIYYPTIDRPQIRDLQFMITDETTFFHTEQRDLDSETDLLDRYSLGYKALSADRQGRYRLLKEITSDPHQSCVLIRAKLEGDPDWLPRLKVYVLLAPHLEMGGAGNSARRVRVAGRELLLAWKERTCLALGADVDFSRTSCGFVGASDGWQDLHDHLRMDWTFGQAEDGNVALTGERGHYELASGRDPMLYLKAIEGFTSKGGMLPEQVWDEDDQPEFGMRRGRPAGAAMPPMWAHAEYLKLLRSALDGQVFDFIPAVADRYRSGEGRKDIEVWKPIRQVKRVAAGNVLRIQSPAMFRLRWTMDDWQTHHDTECVDTGLGIGCVDIEVPRNQRASIRFTFLWTKNQSWEGQDYAVAIAGSAP